MYNNLSILFLHSERILVAWVLHHWMVFRSI